MPIYSYRCSTCDQTFDIQHKMAESPPKQGPGCSKSSCSLSKQIVPVAAVVKSPSPFVSKSGQTAPVGPSDRPLGGQEEKPHQCGSGCAMHKH
jgi:putative FmdB family regulatory protein